jgi:photosystem II stability/assembly factor-like uncharacterized protein
MDDQLLFEQFHAAYDFEPRAGSFERLRSALVSSQIRVQRRGKFGFRELPPRSIRLLAAAVLLAVAVAATGAFIAIHQFTHRTIPVTPPVPPLASGSGFQYVGTDVPYMVSESTGWTVDYPISLDRTTDGGATWSVVPGQDSMDLVDSGWRDYAIDATHAWVVVSKLDNTTFLYRTADGGRSWSRGDSIPTPEQIGQLFFLDPEDGWMLTHASPVSPTGRKVIFRTVDGGLHWTRLGESLIPSSGCEWAGISFVSTTTGWMGVSCVSYPRSGPMLFVTHDGGVTWQVQSQPVTTWNCWPRMPSFTDNAHGTAIACDATGRHVLLSTSDAGRTWEVRQLPFDQLGLAPPADTEPGVRGPFHEQVGFNDPLHGWAVLCTANNELLSSFYRTDDGGRTWLNLSSNLSEQVGGSCVGISFMDANTGLAWKLDSGNETQSLFKTADGGVTWKLINARHWIPHFP